MAVGRKERVVHRLVPLADLGNLPLGPLGMSRPRPTVIRYQHSGQEDDTGRQDSISLGCSAVMSGPPRSLTTRFCPNSYPATEASGGCGFTVRTVAVGRRFLQGARDDRDQARGEHLYGLPLERRAGSRKSVERRSVREMGGFRWPFRRAGHLATQVSVPLHPRDRRAAIPEAR